MCIETGSGTEAGPRNRQRQRCAPPICRRIVTDGSYRSNAVSLPVTPPCDTAATLDRLLDNANACIDASRCTVHAVQSAVATACGQNRANRCSCRGGMPGKRNEHGGAYLFSDTTVESPNIDCGRGAAPREPTTGRNCADAELSRKPLDDTDICIDAGNLTALAMHSIAGHAYRFKQRHSNITGEGCQEKEAAREF